MSSCTTLREAGNKAFRGRRFDEAVRLYHQALCATSIPQDMASLHKNLAVAHQSQAKDRPAPQFLWSWKQCFLHALLALDYGLMGSKPEEWLGASRQKLVEQCSTYIEEVMLRYDSLQQRCQALSNVSSVCTEDHHAALKSHLHLQCAQWYLQRAVTQAEADEYIQCKISLGHAAQELSSMQACMNLSARFPAFAIAVTSEEAKDCAASVKHETGHAQAMVAILEADSLFHSAIDDDYDLNCLWTAVDLYRSSITEAQIELEARACAKIGEIFFKCFKMNNTAQRVLDNFSACSKSLVEVKCFTQVGWWTRGHKCKQELMELLERQRQDQERRNKEPYLKIVKPELDAIQAAYQKGAHKLLGHIWTHHPANCVYKLPDPIAPDDLQKVLRKSVILYHPDKHSHLWTSGEDDKRKQFVIFEQISSYLNTKYDTFKSM